MKEGLVIVRAIPIYLGILILTYIYMHLPIEPMEACLVTLGAESITSAEGWLSVSKLL